MNMYQQRLEGDKIDLVILERNDKRLNYNGHVHKGDDVENAINLLDVAAREYCDKNIDTSKINKIQINNTKRTISFNERELTGSTAENCGFVIRIAINSLEDCKKIESRNSFWNRM